MARFDRIARLAYACFKYENIYPFGWIEIDPKNDYIAFVTSIGSAVTEVFYDPEIQSVEIFTYGHDLIGIRQEKKFEGLLQRMGIDHTIYVRPRPKTSPTSVPFPTTPSGRDNQLMRNIQLNLNLQTHNYPKETEKTIEAISSSFFV